MVANLGDREPPLAKKSATGRRRRRRRESALVWWGVLAAVAVAAWLLHSWRLALIVLLFWCLYEFLLVPTICRVTTRQGFSCREPVRGRLFACTPRHQLMKGDGLWRLFGLQGVARKRLGRSGPEAQNPPRGGVREGGAAGGGGRERETGVVVFSPEVRGRLAQADRVMILLAAAGTVVTIIGMVYGLAR
ncbi:MULTISPECIES: hypothetical protein [Thermomonosporaceae]|uniref:hypothetical protein n=1 Tax=Thermomonosporaceae TaxID=2012 RepID=UPI00255B32F2|nr:MULTISPECIES: hypothetical protein [Thermomonosporaceae]MDL4772804.1 hypothetical protein [Actinomadura xylanilytica]